MQLRIWRISDISDGTFGIMLQDDVPFCLTLERRWLNNKRNVSCIPPGIYFCERILSPKFGDTFMVKDVPGRSEILFHKGNLQDDTHGCIILGEQYEPLGGHNGVVASGKAFREFLTRTKSVNEFELLLDKLI